MSGILDTIALASALVLAIPAALAGLEFLFVRGDHVTGVVLLVLSAGLVVGQQRLTLPSDVPAEVAKRVLGSIPKEPEEDD
ncbi:DUF7533 family protein [Salinilacihabitans rarus]|uniref:DUF7533 family protein n=1 Tax=Salinilacihabitans rarus TaxID=2961596 RepID=UPI0020C8390A|nr:hypothetical protein [Salinilacihabitans rarus]